MAEAITLAGDVDDRGVLDEAVQDCRCGGHVADELGPVFQWPVGPCPELPGGAVLMAAHDDLQQAFT